MSPVRTIFMGTADFACPSLLALTEFSEVDIISVVTQPDRPQGRNLQLHPSPIKEQALKLNLAVIQPERLRQEPAVQKLAELNPDLIVVAAYGQILPQKVLDLPKHGCINVHGSLLPKYRGAAPVQWAMLNGDPETGVTIMKMDAGLDTGPILAQEKCPIYEQDSAELLYQRVAQLGADLLVKTVIPYIEGGIQPVAQDNAQSSYARKITKEDGSIDWSLSGREIWNKVRALTPWPGAYTFFPIANTKDRGLLKIWGAEIVNESGAEPGVVLRSTPDLVVACGSGALRLTIVQREGKRKMQASEFVLGSPIAPGTRLTAKS